MIHSHILTKQPLLGDTPKKLTIQSSLLARHRQTPSAFVSKPSTSFRAASRVLNAMPTKNKAKKRNAGNGNVKNPGKSVGKGGNGKTGKSKKSSRGTKRSGGRSRFAMDIFNEEVMENAYYTCHNIMDVLKCRGFPWPEAQKKKKKKGKK